MANHSPEERLEKITPEKEIPEIKELKRRIEKIEAQLKKEQIPEEREKIVKQEIKNYLQEVQKMPPFASPQVVRDEVKEIAKFSTTQQVGVLVSLVFEKGLYQAISVAKALNNPAILDEFHDVLVDRYYQILVEKGILRYL